VFSSVVAIGNGAVGSVLRTKAKNSSLGKIRQAIAEITVRNRQLIKPINQCPFLVLLITIFSLKHNYSNLTNPIVKISFGYYKK
jgi:hypothetical protein